MSFMILLKQKDNDYFKTSSFDQLQYLNLLVSCIKLGRNQHVVVSWGNNTHTDQMFANNLTYN